MTALPEQPSLLDVPPDDDEPTPAPTKAAPIRVPSKQEAERGGFRAIYFERTGQQYKAVPKDLPAWASLRKDNSVAEIEARWRVGLNLPTKEWAHVDTVWQLAMKWNELGVVLAKSRPVEAAEAFACAICARPSIGDFWDTRLCGSCFGAWSQQGPALEAAKLAHGDKHPGDVTLRGELKYPTSPNDERRWVVLHAAASEQVCRTFVAAWIRAAKTEVQRRLEAT